jgi:Kef-type K+ transport system membrane component KefB
MVATYLLDIVFLLTAAVITVPVFRAIGLGVVPGFLVAGILVGPSGLGLFFISMGMALDVTVFLADPLLSLGLLLALLAVKFAVLWPFGLLFGLGGKPGAAVALLLAQSGEFGLVICAYAFQAEMMAAGVFQQLLVVIVLSMLVTPVLANLAHRLAARHNRAGGDEHEAPIRAPIVLAGFGRVGQRIGRILESANLPYVAIDLDQIKAILERFRQEYYNRIDIEADYEAQDPKSQS